MDDPKVNIESVDAVMEDGFISLTVKCKLLFGDSSKPTKDVEIKTKTKKEKKQAKKEKRIDIDAMSDPPISSLIAKDIKGCIESLKKSQTGHELNCLVFGKYTANWACVISDVLPEAGGRVLCVGDSVSGGKPNSSWVETVGERFGKNVFPVSGDSEDSFQGIDKPFDFILISDCGSYADMATKITRWTGLLEHGGIVCGTQYDEEDYPASHGAIEDLFGDKVMSSSTTSFWYVTTKKASNAKQ